VTADAGVRDADFARPRLGVLDEVIQRFPRRIAAHRKNGRFDEHPGHRIERTIVERKLARMVGRGNRVRVPDEAVAVRFLAGHMLVADRAAGAGPVHYDDIGAEVFRDAVRQQARRHVGRRTRREKHRDLDVAALRKCDFLSPCAACAERQNQVRNSPNLPQYTHSPPRFAIPSLLDATFMRVFPPPRHGGLRART
jgi:hypothetical protein